MSFLIPHVDVSSSFYDYIKHPPPTLYSVSLYPLLIHFNLRILCVYTPCVCVSLSLELSLSLVHTRTYHLFHYTESTTILYTRTRYAVSSSCLKEGF